MIEGGAPYPPVALGESLDILVYIISHLSEGVSRASPEHLASGGRLHVPNRDLIVATHGRDEGGGVGRVGTELVHVVYMGCMPEGKVDQSIVSKERT